MDADSLQAMLLSPAHVSQVLNVLRASSDRELFFLGIENRFLWQKITSFLADESSKLCIDEAPLKCNPSLRFRIICDFSPVIPVHERHSLGRLFAALPMELYVEVIDHLNVRELAALAGTCRFFNRECSIALHRYMVEVFSSIGLSWVSVRFMLTHTDGLISGLFINHMLFFKWMVALLRHAKLWIFTFVK
jgi:hypothetical protein